MDLNEFEKDYIHTTRIEFDNGEFVVLREPTQLEMKDFSHSDDAKRMDIMFSLFPVCIVDHSFSFNKNGKEETAKNDAVGKMLQKSFSKIIPIISQWIEDIPFESKSKEKSETSDK